MLCRKPLLIATLCALVWSQTGLTQTGLTTIQDTLFNADGTRYNGSLVISWSTFDSTSNGTIVQQSRTVPVVNGNLLVQLVPDAGQPSPANVYTVQYQSDGINQFTETWTVPASTQPLSVSQVRTGIVSNNSGGGSTSGGGTGSSLPIAETDVTNLTADLGQRPVKGAGFGTNRVAIVDGNGLIETAVGNTSDCVFVDGTSGACLSTFADAEVPSGNIDGMNTTFTLANSPLGSSLQLFLNGLYQTAGVDYTLSGATIQFSSAAPRPGDSLVASYRVDTSSVGSVVVGGPAVQTASAQVVCSAAGTVNATAAFTTLGTCTIPSGGLHPGDSIELRFTLEHAGAGTGFEVQALWGTATVLDRTGSTADSAFAVNASAAISASSADVSVQSWGTALPLQAAIRTIALQAPVVVTVKGRLLNAISSDSVKLTNYTVLRYPAN